MEKSLSFTKSFCKCFEVYLCFWKWIVLLKKEESRNYKLGTRSFSSLARYITRDKGDGNSSQTITEHSPSSNSMSNGVKISIHMGHQPKRKEGSRDKISLMIVLNHISYSYYSTRTTLEVGPLLMWHNQLKRFGTEIWDYSTRTTKDLFSRVKHRRDLGLCFGRWPINSRQLVMENECDLFHI